MVERRYGKVGAGAIRAPSMEPRKGVIAVAAKRPMEVPVLRPIIGSNVEVSDGNGQYADERPGNALNYCILCFATEAKADILIQGSVQPGGHLVCGACIERLIDFLQQELPRRRLRLAMERLASGEVTPEMLRIIEDLSSGAMVVGKKAEAGDE